MKNVVWLMIALAAAAGCTPVPTLEPIPTRTARPAATALPLPAGFIDELVVGGLDDATAIAWAPDGRLFIAERTGLIRVFQDGQLLPTPFLDISSQVNTAGERGLIGLAIHPEFPAMPYVYFVHTFDPPGLPATNAFSQPGGTGPRVDRLLRVEADPANLNVALAGSEVVLLGGNSTLDAISDPSAGPEDQNPALVTCDDQGTPAQDCLPSDTPWHSIGTVLFAPDGSLLVGHGEASAWQFVDRRSLRAQNLDSLAGKIMRIDPLTGEGYPDNPFLDGDPTSNRSKILNYGLRNPFRFAVDPTTNELYIGDVGTGIFDEINRGTGKNFGWPCYEGGQHFLPMANSENTRETCAALYAAESSAVTMPLHAEALPETGGAALVMGDIYTGDAYPEEYRNAIFFADFMRGWIRYAILGADGTTAVHEFTGQLGGSGGIVQLRQGPDGSLYYVLMGGEDSQVRRLRYDGAN